MRLFLTTLIAFLVPLGAAAQVVRDCADAPRHLSAVHAMAEPFADNTRTYANGAIRLVVIDTVEPACCTHHLVVLHPDADGMFRQCSLVSLGNASGADAWSFVDLKRARASYDAQLGLKITLPASLYDFNTGGSVPTAFAIRVNQATGRVTIEAP